MNYKKTFIVTKKDTAKALGSGGLEVLATPALIAMIENTCYELLNQQLSPEKTSVGTLIELQHLQASKVGAEIIVCCESTAANKRVEFTFTATENEKVVGTGKHQRAIVDVEHFMKNI